MAIITRVYLVRHGETDANRNGIIQGQLDTPLNGVGIKQASLVGEALRDVPFSMAYSSDLSRATRTAEAILAHHPTLQVHEQKELRERDMGDMQGKSAQALKGVRLVVSTDRTVESGPFFAARAVTWWNRTILQRTESLSQEDHPQHILVTSHGGFIATLVQTLIQSRKLNSAPGIVIWGCVNSSVTIIEVNEKQKGVVIQYGNTSHLEGANLDNVVEENVDETQV
ncbi:phosphoglycerate mutase-like protein [Collybia nuda]|uniref:Phosphoglycerate mutase-like protein n=1 Tax=Collybia nuda TaxID=64659 RepID=A0A9P6CQR9_9AGAR|nr:phosphoglycerate mutase-like protein [Collybia nuda]